MQERNVVVRDGSGSVATMSLVAVVVIAALVALFIWAPWNNTSMQRTNSTTIQQGTTGSGTGTTNSQPAGSTTTTGR